MNYRIFTLHPEIFQSFLSQSLIARGISKDIINVELCNWREQFGVGNYKQVDDRPYGGGNGMVLMPAPIFNALSHYNAVSDLYNPSINLVQHRRILPNNSKFFDLTQQTQSYKKATVMLTPRGYGLNQKVVEWLTNFDEINILCGRYEGFDSRVSECVDMEISVGDYVLNGGEVAAMSVIEAVSRLLPGFVTKNGSVLHDSFSSELNVYNEMREYVIGKSNLSKTRVLNQETLSIKLFEDDKWVKNQLSKIEHPQYTRPNIWSNWQVPEVLLSGDHKQMQNWRQNWYKFDNLDKIT